MADEGEAYQLLILNKRQVIFREHRKDVLDIDSHLSVMYQKVRNS